MEEIDVVARCLDGLKLGKGAILKVVKLNFLPVFPGMIIKVLDAVGEGTVYLLEQAEASEEEPAE